MLKTILLLSWQQALVVLLLICISPVESLFTEQSLEGLRNETLDMFYHGWNSYMDIAFPKDELRPISCVPLEKDPDDVQMNDVLGGYALTMLDSLDMFATTNETAKFHAYIGQVVDNVSFDVDSTVQVFETTIRAMGGLLSSHLYASVPKLGQSMPGYDGKLLELAYDLGERLLPAFDTPTGIPHPRVHLQKGIVKVNGQYITETCPSGAGSLLLEFGLLSKLTGDNRFEFAARRAFLELWARRSTHDLMGMSIDSKTGQWLSPVTGVGASIDSIYEYAVKYYVLFGDEQFYSMFSRMYDSLVKKSYDGWVFTNTNFQTGNSMTTWIDSLGAFFPGLLVLSGDLEVAVRMHLAYYKLWVTYGGLPERWSGVNDLRYMKKSSSQSASPIDLEWWPLRPEFIESNYYLYQATKDPFYLQVGRGILKDIIANCKVECGFAGIHDVRTGRKADRMESFFFSETAKYLYLLFTPNHPLNKEFSNFVFSTEAHPLWYDQDVIKHASTARFPKVGQGHKTRVPIQNNITELRSDNDTEEVQNVFTKLLSAWEARKSKSRKTPPKRRTKRLLKKEPTCMVWDLSSDKDMSSYIASWDHFYTLNGVYNYTQPEWINERQPDRIAFERDALFYDQFVRRDAACIDTTTKAENIYELSFSNNEKAPRPKFVVKSFVIQVPHLNGVTWRFKQAKASNGEVVYKITSMDDVQVDERIIEINRESLKIEIDDVLHYLTDGRLAIKGTPIANARVVHKQSKVRQH